LNVLVATTPERSPTTAAAAARSATRRRVPQRGFDLCAGRCASYFPDEGRTKAELGRDAGPDVGRRGDDLAVCRGGAGGGHHCAELVE
jgi:hypothetical protein